MGNCSQNGCIAYFLKLILFIYSYALAVLGLSWVLSSISVKKEKTKLVQANINQAYAEVDFTGSEDTS